jgi:hypothetical protein
VNAYKIFAVLCFTVAPALAFAQSGNDESQKPAAETNSYRYPSYSYPNTSIPGHFGSIPDSRSIPSQNQEPVGPRSIPGSSQSIPSQ